MRPQHLVLISIATALAVISSPVGAQEFHSSTPVSGQAVAPSQPAGDTAQTSTTTPGNPASPGPATLLPIPPPVDLEIAAVLENERRALAVEEAKAAAAAEQTAAEAIVAASQGVVDQAKQVVADAAAVVAEKQSELDTTVAARKQAQTVAQNKADQAIGVGVAMYTSTGSVRDPRMSVAMAVFAAEDIPDASAAKVYRDAVADAAFDELQSARYKVSVAKKQVQKAEAVLGGAKDKLQRATAESRKVEADLAAAKQQAADLKTSGDRRIAAAAAEAPSLKSTELAGGLAILGDPLVSAKDLAAFARRTGRPHPSIDLEALAETFIAEGRAEGVRADVAWVQSIIETGWFSFGGSMVLPGDYNYAGIGACDSCSRGIIFKSMTDGVRTQIQLLRTYATRGLSTPDLANPPPRLKPEKSSVRGCCGTWMKLSGVWATGPGYGIKILTLYNQLLSFAAAQRLQEQRLP